MTLDHAQRRHCEHSPSAAYRWMACPGSVNLIRRSPPAPSSVYAREGTSAHELAQYCLEHKSEPQSFLLEPWDEIDQLDADFVDAVDVYVQLIRELIRKSSWHSLERQFYLDTLNPPVPMYGTSDFCCVEGHVLHVVDYKHGKGVVVEVEGNPQLRYYALGAYLSLPQEVLERVEVVAITVVQPRAYHPCGPIRNEMVPLEELLDFTLDLFDAVKRTLPADAPLIPGDHCRFCGAHAVCPAVKELALELAGREFMDPVEPAQPPAPELLTDDQLGDLLGRFSAVEDWMSAVREYTFNLMMQGVQIPGWKLVQKRAMRKWQYEEAVLKWAKANGYEDFLYLPADLRSPAQMEKAVGKKNLPADLYVSISSGLTLAAEHDARPAATITTAAEEFAAKAIE